MSDDTSNSTSSEPAASPSPTARVSPIVSTNLDEDSASSINVAPPTPGLIVLQWLTYAFWGWTVFATSILSATVLAYFINDEPTGSFMPYGIAAVLVLLPIAIVCELSYGKREPDKKTGASAVVMVIHAVIFALFTIGSLITVVFSLINLFVNTSSRTEIQIVLYSALIVFFLYGIVFLRTLLPKKLPWIKLALIILMAIAAGLMCILGLVGPVAGARQTRTDRLIENNLSSLTYRISEYSASHHQLPQNLSQLDLSGEVKTLVDENLVTYKPEPSKSSSLSISNYLDQSDLSQSYRQTYYYQLCVDFKKTKRSQNLSSPVSTEYSTSLYTYGHPSGEVCYKVKTD